VSKIAEGAGVIRTIANEIERAIPEVRYVEHLETVTNLLVENLRSTHEFMKRTEE
jgi:hypothetical protein